MKKQYIISNINYPDRAAKALITLDKETKYAWDTDIIKILKSGEFVNDDQTKGHFLKSAWKLTLCTTKAINCSCNKTDLKV